MIRPGSARQAGVALVSSLVMMLVVLLIGVAAARAAIHAEQAARFQRDRHTAFSAAEAALADAERDIDTAAASAPGRAALFEAGPSGLNKGCGRGQDDLGLCRNEQGNAAPQWQQADLAAEGLTVAYGTFTGARMGTDGPSLPALVPRYIIEFVPVAGAPAHSGRFFRITAIGFGTRRATRVVLQSYYRIPEPPAPPGSGGGAGKGGGAEPSPPAGALPAARIAWREIANWPELHQAAIK